MSIIKIYNLWLPWRKVHQQLLKILNINPFLSIQILVDLKISNWFYSELYIYIYIYIYIWYVSFTIASLCCKNYSKNSLCACQDTVRSYVSVLVCYKVRNNIRKVSVGWRQFFDNMAIKSYAILSGFTLMILLRNLVTFVLNFKKQNKHDYMRENEKRERERGWGEKDGIYTPETLEVRWWHV